jgi:uncharacterized membrane protein YhaH (DUF805 family)
MNRRTNIIVILIMLGVGVLLTYLLFFRFHILFIFLLFPLIIGGSALSRIFRPWRDAQKSWGQEGGGQGQWGQEEQDRSYPEKQKEFYQKDYKVYGEDEEETENKS